MSGNLDAFYFQLPGLPGLPLCPHLMTSSPEKPAATEVLAVVLKQFQDKLFEGLAFCYLFAVVRILYTIHLLNFWARDGAGWW